MKPLAIETSWPLPVLWPNSREHRMRTYSARKSAKDEGFWSTRSVQPFGWKHEGGRFKLTITAHPAVQRTRDDDGLIGACKAYRDGIALALGVDDSLFDLQPINWGDKRSPGRLVFNVEPQP